MRLWYPYKGGHVLAYGPVMEHEILGMAYSKFKVIGVTDILILNEEYVEAVNLVIEPPIKEEIK